MSGANEDGTAETGADVDPAEDRRTDADEADPLADVPEWDDEYVNEVAGRLVHNYDLDKDRAVEGESFDLYGEMELHSEKHMFHPALSFAHHESHEHLCLRRVSSATVTEIDRLVELGHDLSGEWIDPGPEHYSTDFTFVLVAPEIPADVRDRIAAVGERTLLKYGYNGHYDVHVAVVAPERQELVASDEADVGEALTLWEPIEKGKSGVLGLIARRFQL